jgi:hypothetical protein
MYGLQVHRWVGFPGPLFGHALDVRWTYGEQRAVARAMAPTMIVFGVVSLAIAVAALLASRDRGGALSEAGFAVAFIVGGLARARGWIPRPHRARPAEEQREAARREVRRVLPRLPQAGRGPAAPADCDR